MDYEHQGSARFENGRTCTRCSGHGSFWAKAPASPCCLTFGEVHRAIAAGSPACPNHDHPVLCKWDRDLGRIVPEAGCPLHDLALNPNVGNYSDYTKGRLDP